MSLVDLIKDQLTSEVTSRLGSLIGSSETQTKSALGAAIPALLSAFSGLASTGGGEKLASTINAFDPGTLGRFAGLVSQNPGEAQAQGSGLLDSLLGGSTLSALASTLSKFAGMDLGGIKKLLALVSPLVIGAISRQLQGKPATSQSLKTLFAEEKADIANAMPAGLSLSGIPGLADLSSAASSTATAVRHTAGAAQDTGASLMKTLLPIAALALLGLLGWQLYQGRNVKAPDKDVVPVTDPTTVRRPNLDADAPVSEAKRVSDGLTSIFSQATETLRDVTDEDSAEAALPKLKKLDSQLDGLTALWNKIPAAARTTIVTLTTDNIGKLMKLIAQVQEIPGVGEKLTPVLRSIVSKLQTFEGEG